MKSLISANIGLRDLKTPAHEQFLLTLSNCPGLTMIVPVSSLLRSDCVIIITFLCEPLFLRVWKQHAFFIRPESNYCLPLSLTDSLIHSCTDWLLFSKLDWCDPGGVLRCQLKTCWCYNCCWWGSCWQQFVADLETVDCL